MHGTVDGFTSQLPLGQNQFGGQSQGGDGVLVDEGW